jgi:hypothetical protein
MKYLNNLISYLVVNLLLRLTVVVGFHMNDLMPNKELSLKIVTKGLILTDTIRSHAESRIGKVFRKFSHEILSVLVVLKSNKFKQDGEVSYFTVLDQIIIFSTRKSSFDRKERVPKSRSIVTLGWTCPSSRLRTY